MRRRCSQAGFSLIESMLAGAVLAVVAAIALPSLTELHQRHQARAAVAELTAHLALTRSTSIARGSVVAMCPSSDTESCMASHDWSRGWLVYADPDGNRQPDHASDILASVAPQAGSTLSIRTTLGRAQMRYVPLGTTQGTNATFNICRGRYLDTQLIVSMAGRPRVQRPLSAHPCPS
ncbi:general secretion pathway protein GspH [Xanthomonas vasicola]|uniref:Type II secretion system protein H n=2 Tax=Xanthomonas vasicola TaxID=56459 RepID=A0ABD7S9D6_XANVA|nr:GspH/FimT family pseudopilin [Xanthomonas vasicola]AZR22559.1 prepilin-type N-terminal cleavage/methylation domain-containing protein [Xanthomonas vasicola]PPV01631.1 general secretion pathway protein GspH [Xanthomonas vasicola]TWQ27803.1 prepilin-type N-terminal cleavage/methylation domain-containing protein [Xanthomonas vasicola]TWQ37609.1 prepilin-type N-terminal cleavage/methylation domain-containing protein [Xanthomonas vasicola]TWQ52712.1 prepilin-type N-terminal cleavage/methylation 